MSNGNFNKDVEVIIGTNSGEGVMYWLYNLYLPEYWDTYRETFETEGVQKLFQLVGDPTPEDVKKAHEIINFYVGSIENVNSHITNENIKGMVDFTTDGGFLYGTRKTLDYMRNQGVVVYQYIFSYIGVNNIACSMGYCDLGVAHAEELQYLWGASPKSFNDNEAEIRDLMTTTWANFAKYGDPTPPDSGLSWTPQAPGAPPQYLNINGPNPVMEYSQNIQDRMQLWKDVIDS